MGRGTLGFAALAVVCLLSGIAAHVGLGQGPAGRVALKAGQAHVVVDPSPEGDRRLGEVEDPNTKKKFYKRVAITRPGADRRPVTIFRTGDEGPKSKMHVKPGDVLRVAFNFQITRCRDSDYANTEKESGCWKTPRYPKPEGSFNPIIHVRPYLVAPAYNNVPNRGVPLRPAIERKCTYPKHHCVPTMEFSKRIDDSFGLPADGAEREVAIVVWVTEPGARACDGTPKGCHVMDLEIKSNLAVTHLAGKKVAGEAREQVDEVVKADGKDIPIGTNSTNRMKRSRVVYSVRLETKQNAWKMFEDQLEISGKFKFVETGSTNHYATPPLSAARIVLGKSAKDVEGQVLSRGWTGENCRNTCKYKRVTAATTIPCDWIDGKGDKYNFVNLVVSAYRSAGYANSGGELDRVDVRDSSASNDLRLLVRRYNRTMNPLASDKSCG